MLVDGVKTKSICAIEGNYNYRSGIDRCRILGMEAYTMRTKEEYEAALSYVRDLFPQGANGNHYTVDGFLWNDKYYATSNPLQITPIYSELVSTDVSPGPCIGFQNTASDWWNVTNTACTVGHNFFCEWYEN